MLFPSFTFPLLLILLSATIASPLPLPLSHPSPRSLLHTTFPETFIPPSPNQPLPPDPDVHSNIEEFKGEVNGEAAISGLVEEEAVQGGLRLTNFQKEQVKRDGELVKMTRRSRVRRRYIHP